LFFLFFVYATPGNGMHSVDKRGNPARFSMMQSDSFSYPMLMVNPPERRRYQGKPEREGGKDLRRARQALC
jgi:hypothetical protein